MLEIALKDIRLFFKDKRSVLFTFAIPIALITLFAFAFGGVGKSEGDSRIPLLVSDLDNTPASRQVIALLDSLESLELRPAALADAENAIRKGRESCVLVLHQGLSDSLETGAELPLELRYDEAKGIEMGLLQQSLIPTIAMLPFSLGDPREMMGNRLARLSGTDDPRMLDTIRSRSGGLFDVISESIGNNSRKGSTVRASSGFMGGEIKMTKLVKSSGDGQIGLIQAVAGTSVMMLLFSVVGIGMGLLDEKQEGTLKRLLYTSTNPLTILFGKMISANVISILQLVAMFAFASLVFGLTVQGHLAGLLITIAATAFACSAFGVLLAAFSNSRQQVQGLSTLIILVMSAIGGSMIPLFFMPAFMQKLAVISVNYWSIQGFYDILWRNLAISDGTFITRIAVLVLIGVVLNGLAAVMFRRNILKMA